MEEMKLKVCQLIFNGLTIYWLTMNPQLSQYLGEWKKKHILQQKTFINTLHISIAIGSSIFYQSEDD